MSSETPRIRSRWAASMTAASARRTCWSASRFCWLASNLTCSIAASNLACEPLAGVQGDERRVLADDLLGAQAGCLLLLVGGDLELGVGLQEEPR